METRGTGENIKIEISLSPQIKAFTPSPPVFLLGMAPKPGCVFDFSSKQVHAVGCSRYKSVKENTIKIVPLQKAN